MKMLTLKEFIDKVNLPEYQTGEHNFYMINDNVKYEIEPVYNWEGYVDEIELLEDCENIFSAFSLTEIANSDFMIEKED